MNDRDRSDDGIVIGLEDSETGRAAMAWAARYAQATGVPLHAVHVVDVPPVAASWTPGFPPMAYAPTPAGTSRAGPPFGRSSTRPLPRLSGPWSSSMDQPAESS